MSSGVRQLVAQVSTVVTTAVVTALVQWALYTVSLREDVRALQIDVARLDCRVAILSREMALPGGCQPAVTLEGHTR